MRTDTKQTNKKTTQTKKPCLWSPVASGLGRLKRTVQYIISPYST